MRSNMESGGSGTKRLCAREPRPGKRLCATEDEFVNYDVFISHRGPDTKMGFVGFLYNALKGAGLYPFLDCKSIGKGQDSWKCIERAIQTTPLALVIFSESFAQSEWCLKELHTMLKSPSMKVLPIFYNVQPSEVRYLDEGQLAYGFKKLANRHDTSIMEEWRADLKRASTLNGWEHKAGDKRLEADLVSEVVDKIFELSNKSLPLDVGDHIVGVKQVVDDLIQTLDEEKVLMLGLWGMGGIGKSTLARELYNQLGQRFDARCYVEDVAEKVNQGGVTSVQNHILKALCEKEKISDESRGKVILEERLSKNCILVVLDDVRDIDELNYLMSRHILKEGSMCIVTSRDCRVFEKSTSFDVEHEVYTHDVQLLSERDSQSVFACHAFGGDWKVPPRFVGLVGDVSMACGGVPLVLKVCGSRLRGEEDVEIWEEVLKELNFGTIMDERKIFGCLRISYDALQEPHQEMFLDIACALVGKSVEMAKLVWRSQGWSPTFGVRTLVEKALIRVDEFGAFRMHDHLRDMGRAIAKQDSASLGFYKRLWGSESLALLDKNEPLLDSLQTLILPSGNGSQVDLSRMKGLRILKCEDGLLSMSSLPKNLRWLYYIKKLHVRMRPFPEALENNELVILFWKDDSLESLPKSFGNLRKLKVLNLAWCDKLEKLPHSFGGLQNLENLDLQGSGVQSLPQSFGKLGKLKVLNLSCCGKLEELPDLIGDLLNLEDLDLQGSGIRSLPKSIGMLRKLKLLNLASCDKLMELPKSLKDLQNLEILHLQESGIQSLPQSFGTLNNFKVLNFVGCRNLKELPDSFGELKNLEDLDLERSGIQSLPQSFQTLKKLRVLNLACCGKLEELPDSFSGLQSLENLNLETSGIRTLPQSFGMLRKLIVLNLAWCSKLEELLDSFGGLENLENLDLRGSGIQSLPQSFQALKKLRVLNLSSCGKLKDLPDSFRGLFNLENLNLAWCSKLEELPESFGGLQNLVNLDLEGSGIKSLPQSFQALKKLRVLNLSSCSKLEELPDSFRGLLSLENLNLAWCSKLEELPESFGGLQNLVNLDLKGSGIQSSPQSFQALKKLRVLNLSSCGKLEELLDSFKGFLSLENLNLAWCSKLEELPESFGGLQNLVNLDLEGSGIQSLPQSFQALKKLRVLNLSSCGKLEELPDSFRGLLNLENLNLAWCSKLEELPESFGGLQNLVNLDLEGSGIHSLPQSFQALKKLRVLNLSSCGMLKELPDSFRGLLNLENSNLEGSGIQTLPQSFGALKKLKC